MIAIRLAGAADIPLLPEIERSAAEAFRATPHAWVADDGVTEAEAYPPLIAAGTVWVAEDWGQLAGFVSAAHAPDALHVLELAVHRQHQRRGAGRALMQAAIAAARAAGRPAVTLTTFRRVAFNAPFYRSLGFEEVEPAPERLQAILDAEARHGLADRCAMRLEFPDRIEGASGDAHV